MDITEKRPEPEPTAEEPQVVTDGRKTECPSPCDGPQWRPPLRHRATEPTAKPTEEEARADEQTEKEEDGK